MAKGTTKDTSSEIPAGTERAPIDFDSLPGEISQGRGTILEMQIGQVYGPLKITRIIPNVVVSDEKDAKPVTVYQATDTEGKAQRLPISAIFIDKCIELRVAPGDTIFVRRDADIKKEKGRGKGQMMKDYTIKVTDRAKA